MSEQRQLEHESLLCMFNAIYPLNEEIEEAIVKHSEVQKIKKKTCLLKAGEVCDKIYFIVEGAARVYHKNKEEEDISSWFLFESELLISVYSFFTGAAGFEYLETMEDCTVITLTRDKLHMLYGQFLELNVIGRRLTEFYYIRNEAQANDLRMLTARERYQQLMANTPRVINRVPLGYIASYLGVSQETLSRIRKQI